MQDTLHPAVPQSNCRFPITPMTKKHPQFILAMDSMYFMPFAVDNVVVENFSDGINTYPASLWLEEAQSYLVIREREWLDELKKSDQHKTKGDANYRQLLPYCLIRQRQLDGTYLYYPYRRNPGVGESRLAGKVSIGYGGHIDAPDVLYKQYNAVPGKETSGDTSKSVIDLAATIELSSIREVLDEETHILDESGNLVNPELLKMKFANKFITQNTDPECLHLGIVMILDLEPGWTLQTKEDELVTMEPMTARQLLTGDFQLEAWTRVVLEDAMQNYIPGSETMKQENSYEVVEGLHVNGAGDVDLSGLSLDGNDMNDATFNELVTGDPTKIPTEKQIDTFRASGNWETPDGTVRAVDMHDSSVKATDVPDGTVKDLGPPWDIETPKPAV